MPVTFQEKDNLFTFPSEVLVRKLDEERPLPWGHRVVDFVVYEEDRIIFIEVKDPNQPRAQKHKQGRQYLNKSEDNVRDNWVPKARDSYTILHMMKEDTKPIDYFVVISAPPTWDIGTNTLSLRRQLAKEMKHPWKHPYIRTALIVPMDKFSQYLPSFSCTRISADEGNQKTIQSKE